MTADIPLVTSNPDIMGGEPCVDGTHIPVPPADPTGESAALAERLRLLGGRVRGKINGKGEYLVGMSREDLATINEAAAALRSVAAQDAGGERPGAPRTLDVATMTYHRERPSPQPSDRSLRCRCGRPYEIGPDLVLSDDVWAKIAPRADGGGVLCPNCIHDALVAAGIADGSVTAVFKSGPMADAVLPLLQRAPEPADGGWRLVPIKPTEKMVWVGNEAAQTCVKDDPCGKAAQHVWADMLAAIPAAPQGDADRTAEGT